jgi:hypothetical protein
MLLYYAIIICLTASFILSLLSKWGVIEWLQVHSPCELVYKWASCKFCLSFWTSLALSIVFMIIFKRIDILAVPFLIPAILKNLW